MKLSVVSTLYQSEAYILEFYQRVTTTCKQLVDDDYEIILINDGSLDKSLELAIQINEYDSHVTVVDLSRNFGHHKAMMTGLKYAQGSRVFLIDCDLEEEPEWLLKFASRMDAEPVDVIYGVQIKRKGGRFERWSGHFYYRVVNFLSDFSQPANMVTSRLMTRRYVDSLLLHKEREIDIGGLWIITGYSQIPVSVTKHSTSETTYTFGRKIGVLVNAITSFSSFPLLLIFYAGLLISACAALYICFILIQWLIISEPVPGWSSIMASIWLLGGIIVIAIGVLGIYLAKVFSEVKGRPYTIIRKIYGSAEILHDID